MSVAGRAWYARNKENVQDKRLQKLYGITLEEYRSMFEAQGGCCVTCGSLFADSLARTLHVDHSHTSGEVRGLLCHRCNAALGLVSDDPQLLRALADYLEAHLA